MDAFSRQDLQSRLLERGLDALVCSLPKNILLLSGYWPVVGTSLAVTFSDGTVNLVVPKDEEELALTRRVNRVHTFKPHSLDDLRTAAERVVDPLAKVFSNAGRPTLRIGCELCSDTEPASYSAMHFYGCSLTEVIRAACPSADIVDAGQLLRAMRARKTDFQVSGIRVACRITETALQRAAQYIASGVTELEAASRFQFGFAAGLAAFEEVQRSQAFFFVMSGKNSSKAKGAYARSRTKVIEQGDLVLVHCNAYADGYATDITRTFSVGALDSTASAMYKAVFDAREAAFSELGPGKRARDVDRAARSVLETAGFGSNFPHSTGHGVGFGAISPDSLPRLHPASEDIFEPGMVFNVEPAIYVDGLAGIRHCDMVAINDTGFELLTGFQCGLDELVIADSQNGR